VHAVNRVFTYSEQLPTHPVFACLRHRMLLINNVCGHTSEITKYKNYSV